MKSLRALRGATGPWWIFRTGTFPRFRCAHDPASAPPAALAKHDGRLAFAGALSPIGGLPMWSRAPTQLTGASVMRRRP